MSTLRSVNDSRDHHNMTKTSTLKDFASSKVEMHSKKILGKNPPPKLPLNRPKAVASIPSNTVAPPEDKTMTMSTFQAGFDNMQNTEQTSGFKFKGLKKHDYLT